jgi:polyisoprenoid-binding protein YceI
MGYAKVRGRFTDFQGAIRFVEQDPNKTSVSLRIKVASIDTGNEWRDNDLRSDQWFDQKLFPDIDFTSRSITREGEHLSVTGDLTIRGITRSITFPMTYLPKVVKDVREDSQIVFTGTLQINRIEFGVEGKKWAGLKEGITAVSDVVNLEVSILAKRINAPNFHYWVADVNSPHGKVYSVAKLKGVEAALLTFDSLKTIGGVSVETLNTAGLMFMKENMLAEAIAIFRKNITTYPDQSVVYESYGEAIALKGQWQEAERNFRLALTKDPGNMKAKEILRHIQ